MTPAPAKLSTGDRRLRGLLVGMLRIHLTHQPPGYNRAQETWLIERLIRSTVPVDGTASKDDVAMVRRAAATCRAANPHAAAQWDQSAADFAGARR